MLVAVSYFFWGTIILLVATTLFYLIFFSLIYYWHEKKITFIVVPLLFTFEFFAAGFLIIASISVILQYLPDILRLTSSN